MRAMKSRLHRILRGVLETGQRFKVDISPRHYYSEMPDFRAMRRTTSWRKPMSMVGVRGTALGPQAAFFSDCCASCREQLGTFAIHEEACRSNGAQGYGPVEGLFLYAFIRRHKPARVVQIGCGVSTAIILRAVKDGALATKVICIEPFPTDYLKERHRAGEISLIQAMAQDVDVTSMTDLGAGDLLFIDSTHTVRVGSEVPRIMHEVLPRLAPGVWVHFHDIYFPFDYGPPFMTDLFFGRESTMLHAFLTMNSGYEIAVSQSMLHHGNGAAIKEAIPVYAPQPMADGLSAGPGNFPSAIYLRRTA